MTVLHPAHERDATPAAVTVGQETYQVDSDGVVDCPDAKADRVAQRLADAHGCDPDTLVTTPTCDVQKHDGEICGRDLPCPYHTDPDGEQ